MEIKPVLMNWRISTVKMPILPKAIYGVNAISMKISRVYYHFFFFGEIEKKKSSLEICIEEQRIPNSPSKPEKNEAESITVPDFRLYYKSIVLKIEWCCFKNRRHNGKNNESQRNCDPYMVH